MDTFELGAKRFVLLLYVLLDEQAAMFAVMNDSRAMPTSMRTMAPSRPSFTHRLTDDEAHFDCRLLDTRIG